MSIRTNIWRGYRLYFGLIWTVLFPVTFASPGLGQLASSPGIAPFTTLLGNDYDRVDPSSSTISVTIPVRHKAAGKLDFSYSLQLQSSMVETQLGGARYPTAWFVGHAGGLLGTNLHYAKFQGCYDEQPYITDDTGYSVIWRPDGNTYNAIDGTGWTMTVQGTPNNCATPYTLTLYDRSGNHWQISCNSSGVCTFLPFIDPDGVQQFSVTTTYTASSTTTQYTDAIGSTALITSVNNAGYHNPDTFTYYDSSNQPHSVTINYSQYTLATNFACSLPDISPTSVFLPSSVVLGDKTKFTITYEATPNLAGDVTGRIAKLTLPTGGSVSYSYSGGNNGINCTTGVPPVLQRTESDRNGHSATWTYTNNNNSLSGNYSVTEQDPAGDQTVYNFVGGLQTQAAHYQGAATGTPLSLVTTCYNTNFSGCATWNPSSLPEQVTQTDVYTSYNGSGATDIETKYDSVGNKTDVIVYDFGTSFPPSQSSLSHETTAYGTWNNSQHACASMSTVNSSIGSYMRNYACQTTTTGSGGGTVMQEMHAYNSGGHPTQNWMLVGGSQYLTSTATYNGNGTTASSTDVNGTVVTYGYDGSGGCSSLLPTSVAAAGLTATFEWSCYGGVVTQVTDPNGSVTKYGYDSSSRVNSITDPLGNVASVPYVPATSTAFATVESVMNFPSSNPTSTVDVLYTIDGLGRLLTTQMRTGPNASTFDRKVQYTYGWTGSGPVTGPFRAQTVPGGTATTTSQMDALGRVTSVTDGGGGVLKTAYSKNDVLRTLSPAPQGENTKSRQLEYDGSGRLTSVCEILSSGGTSCGQNVAASGYKTSYIYSVPSGGGSQMVVNHGVQSRTYVYDALSRLTTEVNPESGTTTYTYDSDPTGTCPGTSAGDLVKRVDNAGNVSCYTYDGLHRKLSTTYTGPNSGTNRYFVYDAATLNGQSVANAKGRIAEAYTATCQTCSKVTDEGFGYTARGEVSDFYESTPHSGGYYHIPMTYWANGLIDTFGPFLTEPQYAVTPDGEGRMGAISDLGYSVPSITYYPSGLPNTLQTSCAGSTCYPITYQYDPNTLRMTQYSAALNGGTISGTLTWNPNGSLQQLVIADPFNSADQQTCYYSADDLNRIASVNCVNGSTNVWAQNFTYDQFGNITKSGSISWGCATCYGATTNRYNSTLSPLISYDANGDVTNDSFNQYTWDAEGKPLSTAYSNGQTYAFVYDAFGHQVEWSINETYNSSRVRLGNFKLSAIGQNAFYSEYPFPGGSLESENGGATGVQLGDWLGTSRAFYSYTGGNFGESGAHAPFGESYSYIGGFPLVFTGQDAVDNANNSTYYFPERQYRSSQGRWLSPDPAGLAAADPTNPQSWNRYAYVLNNPMSIADSTGLLGNCGDFGDQGTACDTADNSITFGSLGDPAPIDPLSLPSDAFGPPLPIFDPCAGGGCPLPEFSGSTSEVVNVFGGRPDDIPLLTIAYSLSGPAGNTKRSNPCAGRKGSDLVYSDTAKQHIIDEHINGNPAIKSQYLFNDPVSTTMKFAAVQAYNSFTFNTGSFTQRPQSLNIVVTTFIPPWLPIPVSTGGLVQGTPFIGFDKNSGGDTNFNTVVLLKDCVSVVTSHAGLP